MFARRESPCACALPLQRQTPKRKARGGRTGAHVDAQSSGRGGRSASSGANAPRRTPQQPRSSRTATGLPRSSP
eukprot:11627804-Alexandrium_andersonii.AAC.1